MECALSENNKNSKILTNVELERAAIIDKRTD